MLSIGFNNIGSDGCRLVSKIDMPQLERLELGSRLKELVVCNIGSEGVKHIIKGNWPNLLKLWLCNKILYMYS